MTVWFVTRHSGAVEWAQQTGIKVDKVVAHLEQDDLQHGDKVLGTLPVNLIAELNASGVRYFHLVLDLPAELRGQELSAEIMQRYGARLEQYWVERRA